MGHFTYCMSKKKQAPTNGVPAYKFCFEGFLILFFYLLLFLFSSSLNATPIQLPPAENVG